MLLELWLGHLKAFVFMALNLTILVLDTFFFFFLSCSFLRRKLGLACNFWCSWDYWMLWKLNLHLHCQLCVAQAGKRKGQAACRACGGTEVCGVWEKMREGMVQAGCSQQAPRPRLLGWPCSSGLPGPSCKGSFHLLVSIVRWDHSVGTWERACSL